MNPLLEVENLRVEFHTDEGIVGAVGGISFSLAAGQTLGIVGESGSGKSATALALLGLLPRPAGRVAGGRAMFDGVDLVSLSQRKLARLRGQRVAMIFQDPLTALNPFLTIGEQLTEVTRLHLGHNRRQAADHAAHLLDRVGIPAAARRLADYPHQLSGGMRQRVMIAIALACHPTLLIADEPTTALDVTIQAQILELLADLQRSEGMALMLITHDLGVVARVCDRVLVMYAGRIVEDAEVRQLFARPRHPYTRGLLASLPRTDSRPGQRLTPIPGQPPHLADLPPGCAFRERCPHAIGRCEAEVPPLIGTLGESRYACYVDLDAPANATVQPDAAP